MSSINIKIFIICFINPNVKVVLPSSAFLFFFLRII
jgi:hypothetical protein